MRMRLIPLGLVATVGFAAEPVRVSEPRREEGAYVHTVVSPYQGGPTEIRVLTPDAPAPGARYPVVYVLPVEAGRAHHYGDGLREVQRHDLANRLHAIFVAPTFAQLPWYADHPTDPAVRQEGYFLEVVVPFVEGRYPARSGPEGRLLLGFSKSGWGAWTLLLRHPDRFGKAAAWDAPLLLDKPGAYGSEPIFGTRENFEAYQVTKLLGQRAPELRDRERLILLGSSNFREQHEATHEMLLGLRIPHVYVDGPLRKHTWESGWVPDAAARLLSAD